MITSKKEIFPGVWVFGSEVHCDSRGFFRELYKSSEWDELGLCTDFKQDNVSYSGRGVIRGLHYCRGGQIKLVQVLLGTIQAVVLDLRYDARTLGQYVEVELGVFQPSLIYISPGFAFGFCVTSADALVHYKVSTEYDSSEFRGIMPLDADLDIPWKGAALRLSEADETAPSWKDYLRSNPVLCGG